MTDDNTRRQVNVDFTKYPELYRALLALEDELDTDASKLIRNLVREKAQKHGHLKKSSNVVTSGHFHRHV